ncbi:hypothetical protein KVT40_003130 [Elsinoe batatas]|uniref:Uncharacterized protein n=1 Tax=Elsinoe batatas TaxID=2601811 RepID=A0A8K0PEI9_9PEZI|nr:hypothetical protein KVT40_003130 [Elsinoe batatas]
MVLHTTLVEIEHHDASNHSFGLPAPYLRRCSSCKSVKYVRLANRAAEIDSKDPCPTNSAVVMTLKGGIKIANPHPYTRLRSGIWLHHRPAEDVFKLLIDTFRRRCYFYDEMEGPYDKRFTYEEEDNTEKGLRYWLRDVEKKPYLLPDWWNEEEHEACVASALVKDSDYWVGKVVDLNDTVDRHQDPSIYANMAHFRQTVHDGGHGFLIQMEILIHGNEKGRPGGPEHVRGGSLSDGLMRMKGPTTSS